LVIVFALALAGCANAALYRDPATGQTRLCQ